MPGSSHYQSFVEVEKDARGRFGDEAELRQAFIETLKEEFARTCSKEEMLTEVEEFLVHLTVRGRSIDSYRFKFDEYIIFTHDPATLKPTWSKDQKIILETFGLLRQGVEVKASEGILRYVVRNVGVNYKDAAQKFIDSIQISRIKSTNGDAYE